MHLVWTKTVNVRMVDTAFSLGLQRSSGMQKERGLLASRAALTQSWLCRTGETFSFGDSQSMDRLEWAIRKYRQVPRIFIWAFGEYCWLELSIAAFKVGFWSLFEKLHFLNTARLFHSITKRCSFSSCLVFAFRVHRIVKFDKIIWNVNPSFFSAKILDPNPPVTRKNHFNRINSLRLHCR